MRRALPLLVALGLAGCLVESENVDSSAGVDGPDDITDEMPEDLPAGECRDGEDENGDPCESGESSSGTDAAPAGADASAEPCEDADDCQGVGACAAGYADGDRGEFTCRFACIPTLDETTWCRGDASCCDEAAICTPRGYCVVTDDGSGSDTPDNGPKLSDQMPEDLPAGDRTGPTAARSAPKDGP